jgi:hypothetical protein
MHFNISGPVTAFALTPLSKVFIECWLQKIAAELKLCRESPFISIPQEDP